MLTETRDSNGNECVVVDYEKRHEVLSLPGRRCAAAPDGSVFSLGLEECGHFFQLTRIRREGREESFLRIPRGSPSVALHVSEVVPLSSDDVVYRVADEHELRYLGRDGKPFYSGGVGHGMLEDGIIGPGPDKEQFTLSFSPDGNFGAFAERNVSELTYIVAVDLRRRLRIELPYWGAFPVVRHGYVLFSSDPSFVALDSGGRHDWPSTGMNPFRPISKWAIYAFELRTHDLCLVGSYNQPTQPY